ncbi:MAG: PhoH family protein [Clostridia bacterium]|nr:PhoH family protein [Clostridia bacterium]
MERILQVKNQEEMANVFGVFDENIRTVEREYNVQITQRDEIVKIKGEEEQTELAAMVIENLLTVAATGEKITAQNVNYMISAVNEGNSQRAVELSSSAICVTAKGKTIKAKTVGQAQYIEAIIANSIVFGIGPAGTGKTYLAVAAAVNSLRNKEVNRIILTRPAIEAGEKLGFLPGDLQNKVDPYLRPLYDALHDMLGAELCQSYLEKGIIEVAPLAYMRGRTLDDSYIILDEAQNTTTEQMKMFLTRIGFSSKAVVTGDVTQIDLPYDKTSGLKEVQKILKDIDGIAFCRLTEKDVVRHPLVQKIITAYEEYNRRQIKEKNKKW